MKQFRILVRAEWDDEAQVWVATSEHVPGLCVEAETHEALQPKVLAAIRDLLEFNGDGFEGAEIPVNIMSERLARIPNPGA
jgi:hypothetical protein